MTMRSLHVDAPVIMVVEDERITALDLKRRLEGFGYHVPPIASTGAEALIRAAETRPDLILMDIMLKGPIDGITAAQQIRMMCNVPSIFLTAYSDEAMIERAKETQPLGYLLKPFEERSLRTTIEIALNNLALQQQLRTNEEALRRHNQYLTSVHELSLSLLNRLDLEPLLESIVLRSAEFVGDSQGFIDLHLPDGRHIHGLSRGEKFIWLTDEQELPVTELIISIQNSGQPMVLDNYYRWVAQPRITEGGEETSLPIIAVPLKADQHFIGVLGLMRDSINETYSALQLETLTRFAGLAAIAFDQVQLYQSVQNELNERRRAEQAAEQLASQRERLIDLSRIVLSSLELSEIFERMQRVQSDLMFYDYFAIYRIEQERQELALIYASDVIPEDYNLHRISMDIGIIGQVARSGNPELLNDAHLDPRSYYPPGSTVIVDHMIALPMKAQGRVFGIMVVGRVQNPKFTAEEFNLLIPFAAYASLAIEHSQLYTAMRDELRRRQETQAALQESERRLRLIAENTTDLILAYDMDQRLVYVNPAIEIMLGYTISEMHSMQVLENHPNDEPLMRRLWEKIFAGRHFSEVETRVFTKDAQILWVQASWGPLYDELGHQIGVRGAIRNITEHKRAEQLQALQLAVTRITAESPTRFDAAPRLLQAICINTGWQIGELWKVDPDSQMLIWEAAWYASSSPTAAAAFTNGAESCPRTGNEIVCQAWKADQFVWSTNIDLSPEFPRAALAEAVGLHDAIALPVRAGNVLAILAFYSDRISSRDPDLRTTLESVASQIGQFLERMRAADQLRQYAQQLMHAQEQERARIARELHDEIGQALALVKMNVRSVHDITDTTSVSPRLAQSLGIIEETLQRVRRLALDLRPSMLDDLGLVATLQWYIERQVEWGEWDISIHADLDPDDRLPLDLETACFRVAQEALTNIARHAQATTIGIDVWQDSNSLHMQIRDNGIGFDVQASQERAARGLSVGLLGMRERVALAGGELTIHSAPNQGTLLWVQLPYTPKSH